MQLPFAWGLLGSCAASVAGCVCVCVSEFPRHTFASGGWWCTSQPGSGAPAFRVEFVNAYD